MPEANENRESQPLEWSVREDEGSTMPDDGKIDAHRLRRSEGPDVNADGHERPAPTGIRTELQHLGKPVLPKKNITEDRMEVESTLQRRA